MMITLQPRYYFWLRLLLYLICKKIKIKNKLKDSKQCGVTGKHWFTDQNSSFSSAPKVDLSLQITNVNVNLPVEL